MIRRLGKIVIIFSVVIHSTAFAKLEVHPSVSITTAITPRSAVTDTSRATDFYNDFGGSMALVWNNKWEVTPAIRFGFDTIAGQLDTYTNPGLELAYYFNDNLQERLETNWLVSNEGGYIGSLSALNTWIKINDWLTVEAGPKYFRDNIQTQQVEGAVEVNLNANKWLDFSIVSAAGSTFVVGQSPIFSYTGGGGFEISFAKVMHWDLAVIFAHGLSTDSPYAILNSTANVNVQTGSRAISALDPGGNTVTISSELSAEF